MNSPIQTEHVLTSTSDDRHHHLSRVQPPPRSPPLVSSGANEMTQGDGPQAQAQPQTQTQTHANRSNESSRGAPGARRGRGRGGRGRERTAGPPSRPEGRGPSRNAQPDAVLVPAETGASSPSQQPPSSAPSSADPARPGRGGRGRRGHRPAERGGHARARASQGPRAGPLRSFGGHLTAQADEASTVPMLSADAPEFVPGQPVAARPTLAGAPRTRKQSDIKLPKSTAANLGVRIHEDISNRNYECAVCTDDILRTSHIWSCTVCWTVVHLKCAKKWFHNQQKESAPPPGEAPAESSWRCPGCNSKLVDEPGSYHCWCGKDITPKPSSASLPPHSCGQTCSKPRATCPHPCPLQCHAGPCPPCDLLGPEQSCFCGKNASRKLCRETDYEHGWSCQEICGDLLPCGEHFCPRPCHAGLCGGCDMRVDAKCYCGRLEKTIPCFERGDPEQSFDWRGMGWFEGSFNCEQQCDRNYDCDVHKCTETCHPEEEQPAHCPYSPDVVTHCPCGKTPLDELIENPRYFCQDPIPHCDKVCDKMLPCGHLCKATCHVGDCGFCTETVDIPCRCGRTASPSICHQSETIHEPWCTRACQATLSCGRHRCGERCCPGEKKAAERQALRKKNRSQGAEAFVEAEHICIKTCGRLLKCGSHNCQQICHRGSCASCPEAIFHEISCDCGRTVLHPPLPCGTRAPECRFNCSRRPACGHPPVEHNCHGDDVACPKCPFLVDKWCACGKEKLKSQPCHLQAARCGRPCKKELKCGVHSCRKLCHKPGECEDGPGDGQTCTQTCGRTKLFCDHPCQSPCHGHTACIESAPCTQKAIVSCPCGLRQQEVKCLASSSNPDPSRPEIKCDDECLRLERNRRLAAALNIDPASHANDHIPYSDTTLELFRENTAWAETQEREFRVFSKSAHEQRLRYKPMPRHQRQFLHCLAGDYGLDSASEDVEPHRYVLVWKGQKFVAPPSKTLAQCVKILDARGEPRADAQTEQQQQQQQPPPPPAAVAEPFNAFLLIGPRFGLTVEDVDTALRADLAAHPSFAFSTTFVSAGEEVLIRAAPHYSALLSPASAGAALAALKPKLAAAVSRAGVAQNILLCHADGRDDVSRRENIRTGPDAAGWSAVAGRAAARSQDTGPRKDEAAAAAGVAQGRRMLGLRRKGPDRDKLWTAQLGGDAEC